MPCRYVNTMSVSTYRQWRPCNYTDTGEVFPLLDTGDMPSYKRCVSLGQRLRARRRDLELHGEVVAQRLGVKQPTVSRWENGRCPPRTYWPAIAEFLEIPVTEVAAMVAAGDTDPHDEIRELRRRLEELERRVEQTPSPPGRSEDEHPTQRHDERSRP